MQNKILSDINMFLTILGKLFGLIFGLKTLDTLCVYGVTDIDIDPLKRLFSSKIGLDGEFGLCFYIGLSVLLIAIIFIVKNSIKQSKEAKEIPTTEVTTIKEEIKIDGIEIIDGVYYKLDKFEQKYSWKEAKDFVDKLEFAGFDNWRLPTVKELSKLSNIELYVYDDNWKEWYEQNKNKINSKKHFTAENISLNFPENSSFWTIDKIDEIYTREVSFKLGAEIEKLKSDSSYILAVRKG